jgi:hypothetical protein
MSDNKSYLNHQLKTYSFTYSNCTTYAFNTYNYPSFDHLMVLYTVLILSKPDYASVV